MKYLIRFAQFAIIYLSSVGLYSLWEHYKKTKEDKPMRWKPFLVCFMIILGLFYLTFWK